MSPTVLGGSFRDPCGFVYTADGVLYRQVNDCYREQYDTLLRCGLYDALSSSGRLVRHEESSEPLPPGAYRILKPEVVPYVSYPYEWCFGQLRDAALLTLDILRTSLSFGMVLKDASAYNVQFVGSRPLFIDTLSFEIYEDGAPWVAYRQFCQHFLAPLALMAHRDLRLRDLLRRHVDGLPLDLTSRLLPRRTYLRPGLLAHLHLHARAQRRHGSSAGSATAATPRIPKGRLMALIDSLRGAVEGCSLPPRETEWADYYGSTNYSPEAMAAKEELVRRMVGELVPAGGIVHDLGANDGRFSALVAGPQRYAVAHDADELAVQRSYVQARAQHAEYVLPLVLDLTNPSPRLGWALEERLSSLERMAGGTVLALALIHHLTISNNVPLPRLADFFALLAPGLILEFVPKEDSQVQRLLANREDIFPDYHAAGFERAFGAHFEIIAREPIPDTCRTLFALRRRG